MLDAVIQPIGYLTDFAIDGESALEKMKNRRYDIILTDIKMTPMDGLDLLAEVRKLDPDAIVIMMSGYANVENATRALQLGAFDYLTKPFKVDQLMASVNRAAEERNKLLEARNGGGEEASHILSGDSKAVKKLNEGIARQAESKTPLLITGEPGTQKVCIGKAIHAQSERAEEPFVFLDLKTEDEAAFNKLLFGEDDQPSAAVESAKGGYLYLANIDHSPIGRQGTLGNLVRDLKAETRIVCSSSRDLEQLIEVGDFEDALYFRIATNFLHVPALNDRAEDIPAMTFAYLGQSGQARRSFSPRAIELMQAFRWSNNYTEFEEVLSTAISETPGEIINENDLPEKFQDTSSWPTLAQHLEEQAQRYRKLVLSACQGDVSKASEILDCEVA